uniref:K Homology domain-containing protein n=1 Tax=Anopheles farauti TaxID=69004 RepID=A0A182QYD3_9DIPT
MSQVYKSAAINLTTKSGSADVQVADYQRPGGAFPSRLPTRQNVENLVEQREQRAIPFKANEAKRGGDRRNQEHPAKARPVESKNYNLAANAPRLPKTMDEFSLAFDDNRQSLSVATTATTLAQLTSQFDDLHLGTGDATAAANLLNGLVGSGLGGLAGLHSHHHHSHHHHHTLASLAAAGEGGLIERHHHPGGTGGGQTPNSTNVLDTFVAMVSGLTGGIPTAGGGGGSGGNGGGGGVNATGNASSTSTNSAPLGGGTGNNGKLEERPVKYKSHTECVPVPSSEHVAEIVGRQGCKIKALRAKTNTFIKTPIRGEEPIFVITGTKEDVTRAKQEILSAADHFSTLRSSKKQAIALLAESRNMLGYSMPDEITIQIRVPQKVVGLVVGPKGATIKNIQLKTNTYIITPKRNQESVGGNGPNLGCLSGSVTGSAGSLIGGFLTSGGGNGGLLNGNQYHHHHHHHHHQHLLQQHHEQSHHHHHHHQGTLLSGGGLSSALNDGGGLNGGGGGGGLLDGIVGEHDFEGNQFIIENLLEYFNNMSGGTGGAYNSPTSINSGGNGGAGLGGGTNGGIGGHTAGTEQIPDFRSIWENLSESQTSGTTTDTDNSSLIWTLPSSPRNSVSYSPDDFIFQR